MRPYALGITPQSSVYGSTIPVIYGRTRTTPALIWAANLRQTGGSNKTVKVKKNGPATYAENVDFLIGHNPILDVIQMWQNQGQKLGMDFTSVAFDIAPFGIASYTITDPLYFRVLGVTLEVAHNVVFNDYGGLGPRHLVGTNEYPLWNSANAGPDRVNISGWRWYPWVFRWRPEDPYLIELDTNALGLLPAGRLRIYYTSNFSVTRFVPIAQLRLTFENKLGNGPEYSGYSSQQIIYPDYAGMGSPNLDMGSTQMLPNILPEVLGAFPLYSRADADLADMVEDIFKGVGQGIQGDGPAYSSIHHGLNCYEFPGAIQKKLRNSTAAFVDVVMDLPVTQGSDLIVIAQNGAGSPLTVSDTLLNSWTGLGSPPNGYNVWKAKANGPGQNKVTISPSHANADIEVLEIMGPHDTVTTGTPATGTDGPVSASITTAQAPGQPAYILAVVIALPGAAAVQPSSPPALWNNLMVGKGQTFTMYRIVNYPGTYTFSVNPFLTGDWFCQLFAFSNTEPVGWSKPIGEILDMDSLNLTRTQCRANGLIGSFVLDSQRKAMDWLTDLYQAMDSAPVWSGFKLKSRPYSEVSAVGNGAIFEAETAAGPIVDLIADDFIASETEPMIVVDRRGQVDTDNLLQIQHPSRDADYNDVIMAQAEQSTISMYGGRKGAPRVLRCIQDVAVARMILGISVRRQNYFRNTYKFRLQAKWKLLEPMDLVTLTDPEIGLDHLPVRLTSINETENYELDCEAEPFQYGVCAPQAVEAGEPNPYNPDHDAVPALVNVPVMFEPVAALAGFPTTDELWTLISNSDPNYGGCQVYISTDGGGSYALAGTITGNAITGVTTAVWPAAADPDTVNDLPLDLSESLGELASYDVADKDLFVYPCWIDGGAGPIPYELMTYDIADLTGTNRYNLPATDGLRRSVYDAPTAGVGVAHPIDSRWAFVGQGSVGIAKIPIQASLIGVTLYFKFVAFNQFGGGNQNIADCVAYPFTPTGVTLL